MPDGTSSPILRRLFRVLELFLPTPVAPLLNQLARRHEIVVRPSSVALNTRPPRIRFHIMKQPRAIKMNVSEAQPHRPTFRNLPSFVEVALCTLGTSRATDEKTE